MPFDGISALAVALHKEFSPTRFLVFYGSFSGVRH